LVPLSGTTQIAESVEPNYTSSEGFTYGIIVIGLGTAEPRKALLKASFTIHNLVASGGKLEIRNGLIVSCSGMKEVVGSKIVQRTR
jgi:hypothetical protein